MRSLHFSLLPFSPKRLPAPFLRRVPALARSPQLRDKLSRSDLWTKCPEVRLLAVLPLPGYSFSDGHSVFKVLSIDELSQVYTFLTVCAVYPKGRKLARKNSLFPRSRNCGKMIKYKVANINLQEKNHGFH